MRKVSTPDIMLLKSIEKKVRYATVVIIWGHFLISCVTSREQVIFYIVITKNGIENLLDFNNFIGDNLLATLTFFSW